MIDFLSGPTRIPVAAPVDTTTVAQPTVPPGTPSDADLWELYHKAGVPDSLATALVKSRPSPADAWEHLTAAGVSPDVAKQLAPLGTTDTSISLRNLGRSLGQGATFGFSDELNGLVRGQAAEATQRARQAAFHAAHPVADVLTKVVGGIAAPAVIAASLPEDAAAAGVGGGALALRGAATGGAIAGATAAGENNGTVGQRLKAAAIGAIPGAVLGAAAPVVGSLIGNGLRRFGVLGASPLNTAERAVAGAVARTGGASDAAALNPVLAGDPRATLADMSDPLRLLAQSNAAKSPDAEAALRSVIANRANPNAQLLASAPTDGGTATARLAALRSARRAFAGPAYDAVDATPVDAATFRAQLGKLLSQPKIAQAWTAARQTGLVGPLPDAAAVAMRDAANTSAMSPDEMLTALTNMTGSEDAARSVMARLPQTPTPAPSVAMVRDLKGALTDAASAAYRQGQGNLGQRLSSAAGAVRDFLSEQVPGYGAVDAEYSRRLGLEGALKAGANAARTGTARSIANDLAGLAPDAQYEYRLAMASHLVDRINAAGNNAALARQIANAGPTMQARLEAAFGTSSAFDQFMMAARREAELARLTPPTSAATPAPVIGGQDLAREALGMAVHSTYGRLSPLIRPVSRLIGGAGPNPSAVSDLLMSRGDAITSLLNRLNSAPAAIRPQLPLAAGAGAAAGQVPGLLGSS